MTAHLTQRPLAAAKAGRITEGDLIRQLENYLSATARQAIGRLRRTPACPVDFEDLRQIAAMALIRAVRRYEYRCPECGSATMTAAQYRTHRVDDHGTTGRPAMSLLVYVHGEVGRAIDHEVRRYVRRRRWTMEWPTDYVMPTDPTQLADLLVLEISQAIGRLNPVRQRVLQGVLTGRSTNEMAAELGCKVNHIAYLRRRIRLEIAAAINHDDGSTSPKTRLAPAA